VVPPASHRVSRVPWYSGSQSKAFLFNIQDYYLLRWAFPDLFYYNSRFLTTVSATPTKQASLVWALPFSLATTQGIDFSFSSSGYLDVSVPLVYLLLPMDSVTDTWTLLQVGFPIRTSPDQCLLAASRGLSQLTTSFIGS
jgi:hypothetical protein